MNILVLNAATRKNGYTVKLLRALEQGISKEHKVDWINVNELTMKPCIGCLQCRPDKKCILPDDDAHTAGEKIKNSDGIIIGSPTYFGNITGPLKTLIDRNLPALEYLPTNKLAIPKGLHKGQKAVALTALASPWPISLLNSQAGGTIKSLKTILKNGGYQVAGKFIYSGTFRNRELSKTTIKKLQRLGAKF